VVARGGIATLEAVLALRDLAGEASHEEVVNGSGRTRDEGDEPPAIS
jgi:hypothetical protein